MMWLGIFAAVAVMWLVMTMVAKESRGAAEGHQKVTDEEFLAALPNVDPETALRIRAIISDQLDVPLHDLHPSNRFIEDLKAD